MEYLGVTLNYLLFGKDEEVNTDTLSANEMQLGQKECLMQTAKWFVNVQAHEKNT